MNSQNAFAIRWLEQGLVPDRLARLGIRRLLAQRLKEVHSGDAAAVRSEA
mgnify:CR=1 FL=1